MMAETFSESGSDSHSDRWVTVAAILGGVAVILGAFGAHGLKGRVDSAALENWKTGASYHLIHSVVLLVVSLAGRAGFLEEKRLIWVQRLLVVGIVIFAGTLYALVLTGERRLGAVTPLGGASLITGWFLLATCRTRKLV